ncbi:hypothetical protein Cantr_10318 [Candida viswanathii]|uniref:Uncharacterized protein n=1 Tax=Candida viswanathii TaxID=5486 RepID=A0A367YD54_9ASCO|nr:hypothetical protein Cantr_10318 [Candida viswanathii]
MASKKDTRSKGPTSKISKSKKKTTSTSLSKSKSKSAKAKIDKLNKDVSEISEVQNLLATTNKDAAKKPKALDSIREDLKKDEELKQRNKLAEKDLNKQLELLTEMGL